MKKKPIILFIVTAAFISAAIPVALAVSESDSLSENKTETSHFHAAQNSGISAETDIIKKIPSEKCSMFLSDNYVYTGEIITPETEIKYENVILKKGRDYTLSYDKTAKDVGKYTVTATLSGSYTGTLSRTFYIIPRTAHINVTFTRVNGFDVSPQTIQPEADGYEVQYSKYPCFNASHSKCGTKNDKTLTINTTKDGDKYYVRARAYTIVSIDGGEYRIYSDWGKTSSAILKKIIEKDGITYVDGVLVANKTYSLPQNYNPGANQTALKAFDRMAKDAAKDGITLYIVSGFRSYDLQNRLYNGYCYERGQQAADRVSARPGHSEHQSGLAFDINTTSSAFAGTPEAIWLDKNCWRYGFIIRYMADKEEITGYSYEPWHIRYVGNEVSKKIYDSGLCLEEYYGITSSYDDKLR